jgi:hypothetical protein
VEDPIPHLRTLSAPTPVTTFQAAKYPGADDAPARCHAGGSLELLVRDQLR